MKLFKTSRTFVVPETVNQRFVYVLDSFNPETILAKEVRIFFETMGYSEMFPNFDRLRVGTVHPFAILLSQEVLEQPQSTNVFPAITVADSSATEDLETLSDEYSVLIFHPEDIAKLEGYRQAKEVFVSETGWERVNSVVKSSGKIIGVRRNYSTRHNLDFNIWSSNKDITSFLFDMVCHFIVQKRMDLHAEKNLDMGQLSGRRTGDINLDFGMLLYGANVSVTATVDHSAVLFDTGITSVDQIDVKTLPKFFTLGV